jgi:hypothetical protein
MRTDNRQNQFPFAILFRVLHVPTPIASLGVQPPTNRPKAPV